MDINGMSKKLGRTLSQNSPAILSGMAVAGTVTTAVFAAQGGTKAERILIEERGTGIRYKDLEPTPKEIVSLTWKCYIPAGAMGAATVACIIGAHSVNVRRQAALMTAYSLTDVAFQEYKAKVVEQIGEKKELAVRDAISEDRIKKSPPESSEIIVVGKGETTVFDSISGRYFKGDMEAIRRAVNDINYTCINEMYASLNDFYDILGLEHTTMGEDLGWRSDKLLAIDFSSHLSSEGQPCLALNYLVQPIRGYWRERD